MRKRKRGDTDVALVLVRARDASELTDAIDASVVRAGIVVL